MSVSRRTVKVIAIGYAVKTALFGLLWLAAPDLVRQAAAKARSTWSLAVEGVRLAPEATAKAAERAPHPDTSATAPK